MTDYARFSWTVLLPVKVLARAKSRLAVLAGDRRHELALALASDTVAAVDACPEVARVIVVTSDPVAGPRLAALGAHIVPEAIGDPSELTRDSADGSQHALNAALLWGAAVAARRRPGTGLAALTADLPALRPAELATALRAAGHGSPAPGFGPGAAFVPDAARVGTTLYAVPRAVSSARCSAGRRGRGTRPPGPPSSPSTASPGSVRTWTRPMTCGRR